MAFEPIQANFNAGELSRRLHARRDLNIYDIACAEMTGWLPMVEGGMDAAPGTIRVAAARGPHRLVPFVYNQTQSYIVEMSAGTARFYTNDARIEPGGNPIELGLPWSIEEIRALTWEQSYDVLYLFHPDHQTRQLVRTAADSFDLRLLDLIGGPFEPRNSDEAVKVQASGVTGTVTLTAGKDGAAFALFDAGDVGGLFQMEAADFGDISSWEPGITVTLGQLLTWGGKVYRVVGGSGKTGTVAPVHGSGVEWDGIGRGTDINTKPAGGAQLEYLHDRYGVLRITGYTDSSTVTAEVLRRLPFSAANAGGGYGA
ncbi:hypothetical protein S2M10_29340 [Sphingomonas sp. S2M10]|uniref:hypothetical protein n=1 Tax=Sphingomonas sp. S2M10 TaxID=2705010 RepID=UPI00145642DC|nr:hypothetical protein [Sphingomonas sp. S2M10]NLS27932.1 hypothetical protein [Sphingomonas sp. S2M10]